MKKSKLPGFWPLVMAAAVLVFSLSVARLDRGHRAEDRQNLEEALRRAAVACYAAEGFYPPDVAYLQAHYGLRYDESRYVIHYTLFASNLMPDITVLEQES